MLLDTLWFLCIPGLAFALVLVSTVLYLRGRKQHSEKLMKASWGVIIAGYILWLVIAVIEVL